MNLIDRFRTLRFKLTLMYVIVFGVVQTALSLVLDIGRVQQLRSNLDTLMFERAQAIVERIAGDPYRRHIAENEQAIKDVLNEFTSPGVFVQLRLKNADARLIRSDNLGLLKLPSAQAPSDRTDVSGAEFVTLTGDFPTQLLDTVDAEIRLMTIDVDLADVAPFQLQIARSMAPLNAMIGDFRRMIFLFLIVSLAAAATASWMLARHSFAPIGEIAREATRITARRLDLRLEVPRSGDEIAEKGGMVNEMLERLERSFKSQDRLLGDVSHELKTPIAVLRSEAQRLQRKQPNLADYAEFTHSVRQEMARMNDVVDSFLALSREEAKLATTEMDAVYLPEIVLDAVRHCQEVARSRGIRLVPMLPETDGDDELFVQGDPNLVRIMIENLIRNAKKYSPKGSRVEIEVSSSNQLAVVEVRDEGPGIPEDQLDKVFERAYRVARTERTAKGIGLGLAIAQSIAHIHAGRITAENREGAGSIFRIELPLAGGEAEDASTHERD